MKTNITFSKKVFLSFLYGIGFLVLSFLALYTNYNLAGEEAQVKTALFADKFFHSPAYVNDTNFVFIDVSRSKQLIPAPDGTGNRVITDRKTIAAFLDLLGRDVQHKMILCDVLFDMPSPDDELLSNSLSKTGKLLIPFSKDAQGILQPLFKDVPNAYAGYQKSSGFKATGNLLKYDYFITSEIPGVPVSMFEMVHQHKIEYHIGWLEVNGKVFLKQHFFYPRISEKRLRSETDGSKIIPIHEMNDLLQNDVQLNRVFFKDKIVLIGDFETDIHPTVEGATAGSLILANLFLSLDKNDPQVTISWLLYILLSYMVLSFVFFTPPWKLSIHSASRVRRLLRGLLSGVQKQKTLKGLSQLSFLKLLMKYLNFTLCLLIMSIISFVIFRKHIDQVYVLLYFWLFNMYQKFKPIKR